MLDTWTGLLLSLIAVFIYWIRDRAPAFLQQAPCWRADHRYGSGVCGPCSTIVLTVVRHHCPHCRQAPLSLLSSGGAPSCGCWDTIRTGKDPPLKAHGIFHSVLSQPRARPLPPLPPPPQSGSYLPPSGHSEGWSHTYQREFSLTAGIFRCMARHAVTALS